MRTHKSGKDFDSEGGALTLKPEEARKAKEIVTKLADELES